MKTRYRLIRRGIRGDKFYCVDKTTGKRASLGTASEDDARQIIEGQEQLRTPAGAQSPNRQGISGRQ